MCVCASDTKTIKVKIESRTQHWQHFVAVRTYAFPLVAYALWLTCACCVWVWSNAMKDIKTRLNFMRMLSHQLIVASIELCAFVKLIIFETRRVVRRTIFIFRRVVQRAMFMPVPISFCSSIALSLFSYNYVGWNVQTKYYLWMLWSWKTWTVRSTRLICSWKRTTMVHPKRNPNAKKTRSDYVGLCC